MSAVFVLQISGLMMSYACEVGPINHFNLSEAERNAVLAGFAAALQQLSSPVSFHVKLDTMGVVVGTELYEVKYRRYFVEGEQPPEGFLAAMELQEKYARVMEIPRHVVTSNLRRYAVLDNGEFAKGCAITAVSSEQAVAFLAMDMGAA